MEDKTLKCSNCGSVDVIAKQKGFEWGNAAIGGWLFGGIGFLFAGYKHSKDVIATCRTCNNAWDYNRVLSKGKMNFKHSFYGLYEQRDYSEATALYLSNHEFDESITDIHLAYSKLKNDDRKSLMMNVGFVAFIIIILILIMVTN